MFWDATVKAYLPTENGCASPDGLLKIPYRIFVGGIAFNTTKDELREFFSRYGAVRDSKIIRDTDGLSKGYGFVTFYREEDAQRVMNMGTIFFKEKRLNISEAYRKHQVNQLALPAPCSQQAMFTMPTAAPTTWAPASSSNMTPVYYPIPNHTPQIPTVQVPSAMKYWTRVAVPAEVHQVVHQPETVYWLPVQYNN